MYETISIEGIDKAELLAALYNASQPLGMGFLHYDPKDMTKEEAQRILDSQAVSRGYFDYLHGRVMKVQIGGNDLAVGGYDRDNGPGAAAKVVEALRAT